MYTKRQMLVIASLIGLIVSVLAALIVLVKPSVVPMIPEGSIGRHAMLPTPFLILPGGCGLIGLAMVFWMPAPWYETRISLLGPRVRRCNWALVAAGVVGVAASTAVDGLLVKQQLHAPIAVAIDGRYELRQNFQAVREISAAEYTEISEAQRRQPGQIIALGESVFCICMYLGMALYGIWYIKADPQVDWRDGFWQQFVRW